MSTSKIQKGDYVKVISGNFKGTKGIITSVQSSKKSKRVTVDSIAKIVKYRKSMKQYGMPGQMTSVDRLIDISNVMLLDAKDNVSKVKIDKEKSNTVRKFKTTNDIISKKTSTIKEEKIKNSK
jgi:ribosomal protein L24